MGGIGGEAQFQVEGGKTVIQRDGRQETVDPAVDPFEHLRRLLAGFIPVATPGQVLRSFRAWVISPAASAPWTLTG